MATYTTRGTRRYAYYETRKDLARPGDPPSTRIGQGALDEHMLGHMRALLDDEHSLRRLANLKEANQLSSLFAAAELARSALDDRKAAPAMLRKLISLVRIEKDRLDIALKPMALGLPEQPYWNWSIPLPVRKPFREAKLKIDSAAGEQTIYQGLVALLAEASEAQRLVLAAVGRSINQVAKANGRCRKQLTKLFSISWLSPNIVESIVAGNQPARLTRARLLATELPLKWSEQEALLGFAV